jgi:hypothetical protein
LHDTPTGPFRYGFTDLSGLEGPTRYSTPGAQDARNTLDLQTAVPLSSALRMGVRYKIDKNVRRGRTFTEDGELTNTNTNNTTETTFPALDLAINNVERIRIFGKKLERSNITLGYSRRNTDQFSTNQVPDGPVIEASGRSESGNSTFTANWAGQWKRGVSTSVNLNQQSNSTEQSGPIRGEGVNRSVQGTVRFKVAPRGGLKLPFLGERGRLKSGMDVTLTGSYTTDQRKRFNNPSDPEKFILESQGSAIAFTGRSDYTLSRNMNGGFELGFNRSHNQIQDQTITTLRLGFNITFLF